MVEVRLMKRQSGDCYLEVRVHSVVRPDLVHVGTAERPDFSRNRVGLLAGAIAEGLCERYQDVLEPSAVARAAAAAFDELMADPHVHGIESNLD